MDMEVRYFSKLNLSLYDNASYVILSRHNASVPRLHLVQAVTMGLLMSIIALVALVGNVLVILAVATNRRLRTITNYYVASLATSDLCVSLFVLPLSISVETTGRWMFGIIICEMWISSDVMLCTASILNLCCISLDRYFAITRPLKYATKRSKRLALLMIGVVWVSAVLITCPPMFGWQEEGRWDDIDLADMVCKLTEDPGYIVYSSLGSFFVPLFIMVFVYIRIFRVASKREQKLKPYKKKSFRASGSRQCTRQGMTHSSENGAVYTEVTSLNADFGTSTDEQDDHQEMKVLRKKHRQAMDRGEAVSLQALQQGLVASSSIAMRDIARAHRESSRVTSQRPPKRSISAPYMDNTERGRHAVLLLTQRSDVTQQRARAGSAVSGALTRSPESMRRKNYFSNKEEKRRERLVLLRERKAAKTLAIVVGGFVVCWLPFFLMYVIMPFCKHCYLPPIAVTLITWLGYFNSVLNPFIYAFYNKDFRYSFKRLLSCHCAPTTQRRRNSLLRFTSQCPSNDR